MPGDQELIMLQLKLINDRLEKFDDLFGKLFESQSDMNITLTRNTITVEQHHRRSTILEKIVARFHKRLDTIEKKILLIRTDLDPVKAHVTEVSKMVHFITGLPSVVKFLVGLFTLITMFFGIKDLAESALKLVGK